MKRFFITVLCASLFIAIISVWALGNNQQDKAPAKKENVEKKACCAEKKEGCPSQAEGEKKACCTEKKEGCPSQAEGEKKACCKEKKEGCPSQAGGEKKACCKEKKEGCAETKACPSAAAAAACTNKAATNETKSCGKKES